MSSAPYSRANMYCGLQIKLGDETMSVLEIWGAEYQENDCILIKPEARGVLEAVCKRERCLMQARSLGHGQVLQAGCVSSAFCLKGIHHAHLLELLDVVICNCAS